MNLVYSLAYGSPYYFEVAQVMITSLRRVGYTGKIIILTDKPWNFEGAEAFPIDVGDGLWKCALGKAVNIEDYESILFFDSDQTAVKSIDSLFSTTNVKISGNFIQLKHSIGTNYFLTPTQKNVYGNSDGICSGMFSFPGKVGDCFLTLLENKWKSFDKVNIPFDIWKGAGNVQLWDECALMSLCLDQEIEWEIYPAGTVVFPSIPMQEKNPYDHKNTKAIHFIGTSGMIQNKEKTLEWMWESLNPLKVPVLLQNIQAFVSANLPKSDLQKLAEICLDMGKTMLVMKAEMREIKLENQSLKNRVYELEKVEKYEMA